MAFDPKKAREEGNNQGVPASTYLVAIVWMARKESKKGKPYERIKVEIISGAAKGKTFFDMINLDISNEGAAFRLGLLLGELNGDNPIELEDDAQVRSALMHKPFKAEVNRKLNDGYVNNGIAKILVGDKVTEAEREAMEQWKINREAADNFEGGGGSDFGDMPMDDVPHSADGGADPNDIPF